MQPCLTVVFWRLFRSFFVIFMFWNKMFEWSFLYYKNPSQMVKYGVFIQKKIARKRGFAFTRTLQKHGLHEQCLTAARQNVKQRSDQANCQSAQSWWSIGPEQWPFHRHFYSSQFNASLRMGSKFHLLEAKVVFQLKFRGVLAGAKYYYKCSCALRWRAGIGEGRMPSAHRPAKKAPMASSRRGRQRRRNHDAVRSPRFPFATRWLNIPSSLFFFVFPLVCFFFFLFAFPVKIGRKPQKHRPRINET